MIFRNMFQFHNPSVFTPRSFEWNIVNCCNLRPTPHIGSARGSRIHVLALWLPITCYRLHARTRTLRFMGFRKAMGSQSNALGNARFLPKATQHDPPYGLGHAGDVCPLPPPTRVMTPHNQQLLKRLTTILGIVCRTAQCWCGFLTVPDPLPVTIRDIRNYTPYLWKTQLKRRPK